MFEFALRPGGAPTGEHGVGVLERPRLTDEPGATSVEIQHNLTTVFDSAGILDPGKAI